MWERLTLLLTEGWCVPGSRSYSPDPTADSQGAGLAPREPRPARAAAPSEAHEFAQPAQRGHRQPQPAQPPARTALSARRGSPAAHLRLTCGAARRQLHPLPHRPGVSVFRQDPGGPTPPDIEPGALLPWGSGGMSRDPVLVGAGSLPTRTAGVPQRRPGEVVTSLPRLLPREAGPCG